MEDKINFIIDNGELVSFSDDAIDEDGVLKFPREIKCINDSWHDLIVPEDSKRKIKAVVFENTLEEIGSFFYEPSTASRESQTIELVVFNSPVALKSTDGHGTFEGNMGIKKIIVPEGFSSVATMHTEATNCSIPAVRQEPVYPFTDHFNKSQTGSDVQTSFFNANEDLEIAIIGDEKAHKGVSEVYCVYSKKAIGRFDSRHPEIILNHPEIIQSQVELISYQVPVSYVSYANRAAYIDQELGNYSISHQRKPVQPIANPNN